MAPLSRPVRLVNYLAYGANDMLGAGSMAIVSGWVLLFYTRFCGLSAGQAAIIFATARVIDAVLSPMIGQISDHLGRTALGRRLGRRRVFILAAIPLLPSFALMWLPGQTFWYYLVSYVAFEMVYALEIIPYETLAAEMASDYATKARLAGTRILFGQVSAILAGYAPLWLIGWLGRDNGATFFWMAAIFTVLFMAVAALLYAFSWERPHDPATLPAAPLGPGAILRGLAGDLAATLRVRAFRLHLGMYLGGYISQDIFNATFTFFVLFALGGTTAAASGLLGGMYVVQLAAVALAIGMALRSSPARAYRLAAMGFGAGTVLLVGGWMAGWRVGAGGLWVAIALAGLGRGMLNYIPWATYNYMADVDEIISG
ncbi:MAG TPA: MFS transporter, partial [Novosphingobium sp.]|nr:MFS transporter [Novosphingobium sp.]